MKEGELRGQCWAGSQASEPAFQGPESLPGCPIIHKPWTFGALQDYLKLSRNYVQAVEMEVPPWGADQLSNPFFF